MAQSIRLRDDLVVAVVSVRSSIAATVCHTQDVTAFIIRIRGNISCSVHHLFCGSVGIIGGSRHIVVGIRSIQRPSLVVIGKAVAETQRTRQRLEVALGIIVEAIAVAVLILERSHQVELIVISITLRIAQGICQREHIAPVIVCIGCDIAIGIRTLHHIVVIVIFQG